MILSRGEREREREIPAEYQVKHLVVLLQFRGYVQNVLVPGQRHGERIAVDDAVQGELVHLVRIPHKDDVAHLLDNVLDHGGALGVDDSLGTAGQPVDLPLRVPARANRHDLLHAGHVLAPAVLYRLPEILQAHHRGAVISAAFVVRRCFEVLGQVGLEAVAAREVGGDDAEDAPTALAALRIRALVVGRLLHQLAVNFVAQLLVLVTVLQNDAQVRRF